MAKATEAWLVLGFLQLVIFATVFHSGWFLRRKAKEHQETYDVRFRHRVIRGDFDDDPQIRAHRRKGPLLLLLIILAMFCVSVYASWQI